ncbi:hypothetical protein PMAYCL1PPCAC_32160 [Pristionchus mayeri]|uniref:RING-type domain-containing protein n=1 Tax=Pristionchus mayeri TaxID=1317129 RepID=A0AAN5IF53_9BILA|nr:hypothetical protein PMAYCL1PPCAC_32160 [Pristionchus mayeri]
MPPSARQSGRRSTRVQQREKGSEQLQLPQKASTSQSTVAAVPPCSGVRIRKMRSNAARSSPPLLRSSKRQAALKQSSEMVMQREPSKKEVCRICLENLGRISTRLIDCDHHFHRKCIVQWMTDKPAKMQTCPLCRRVPNEMRTTIGNRKVPIPPPKEEVAEDFATIYRRFFQGVFPDSTHLWEHRFII